MLLFSAAPPVIHSPQNYTVTEGSDVVITFNLLGHPSPDTLQYYMDGISLDLTENDSGDSSNRISLLADRPGSLLIRGVQRIDAGVYSLQARNSVGESTASTQLIVSRRYSLLVLLVYYTHRGVSNNISHNIKVVI